MTKLVISIEQNSSGLYRQVKTYYRGDEVIGIITSQWRKSKAGFYSGAKKMKASIK